MAGEIRFAKPMVDHYLIHCKNCGVAMKFPVRTLSQLSAAPEVRPNQLHAIIAACPHCKRLETYTLHKSFPGWNPEDGAVSCPVCVMGH